MVHPHSTLVEVDTDESNSQQRQRFSSRSRKLVTLAVLITIACIALTLCLVFFSKSESEASQTGSTMESLSTPTPLNPVKEVAFSTSTAPPASPPSINQSPTLTTTTAPSSTQPAQHKYIFSTEKLSWQSARARCRTHGMDLVSIETQEEQDWILIYLTQIGEVRAGNSWWTSGQRRTLDSDDLSQDFVWAATNEEMHFTFWHDGEPNKLHVQMCVEITGFTGNAQISTDGQTRWNSWDCDEKVKFICERVGGDPADGYVKI